VSLPEIASREEWLAARRSLLEKEKELTRHTDAVNTARRQLPMVTVEKEYRFEAPGGAATLLDLFKGRRQLAVYHFMFGPDAETGCRGCTALMDEISPGVLAHLRTRDTAFAVVSRAPLEKLEAYKAERGWTFDWYSSNGNDFNYDFGVTLDASVAPLLVNFRDAGELPGSKDAWALDPDNHPTEISGLSFFLRDGSNAYYTYSAYRRGTERLIGAYSILDLSPLGRQENWEEPKGRAEQPGPPNPSFGGGLIPETAEANATA